MSQVRVRHQIREQLGTDADRPLLERACLNIVELVQGPLDRSLILSSLVTKHGPCGHERMLVFLFICLFCTVNCNLTPCMKGLHLFQATALPSKPQPSYCVSPLQLFLVQAEQLPSLTGEDFIPSHLGCFPESTRMPLSPQGQG